MKQVVAIILALIVLAIIIVVIASLVVFHDYESEKKICGSCECRDDALGFCWKRDFYVGTEDKACSVYQRRR